MRCDARPEIENLPLMIDLSLVIPCVDDWSEKPVVPEARLDKAEKRPEPPTPGAQKGRALLLGAAMM